MNTPITEYARIGLVHHMLYSRHLNDPEAHARTLAAFCQWPQIETLDCCLPYGDALQKELIPVLKKCGKEHITFATHLFPLRKLSFASTNYAEQAQARMIVSDLVRQAAAIGSTGFIFASGGPPEAQAKPEHYAAFKDFFLWLCRELKPHGISALLEPFDMDFDKSFLMGSTRHCVEMLEDLSKDVDNLGIELDMAHLPLMRETFAEAVHTTAPWLKRVHLGNCVMRDKTDRFYGDNHPPMGYPGGEIDVEQLVEILGLLLEVGFLNKENRGDLVVELNPFPGMSEEDSVKDNFKRLNEAWAQVQAPKAVAS